MLAKIHAQVQFHQHLYSTYRKFFANIFHRHMCSPNSLLLIGHTTIIRTKCILISSIIIIFSDIILSNWSIISFTNHICVWSLSFWAIIYTIFCAIPISKEFPSIWQESSPNNYVTHWTNFRNQSFPVSLSVPSDRYHRTAKFLN